MSCLITISRKELHRFARDEGVFAANGASLWYFRATSTVSFLRPMRRKKIGRAA